MKVIIPSLLIIITTCLVLVCYRNYRYPGCTTRTSVPSQPTLQNKEIKLVIQNPPRTHTQTKPPPHQHHTHHRPTQHHRQTQPTPHHTIAQPNITANHNEPITKQKRRTPHHHIKN